MEMLGDAPYKLGAMRNGMPDSSDVLSCGHRIYAGELMVEWDDGETLCPDCFEEKIKELLLTDPERLADALGLATRVMEG